MRWILTPLLLLTALIVIGYEIDINNPESIKNVTQRISYKMMQFYPGNQTGMIPGLFGDPYYWWEAGAVFGALIDYWYYTGDEGYNPVTTEAMLHQVGPDADYMPPNQSVSMGNDDQAFWAFSAMTAAEKNFPNPPPDKPQWLALAQAVFNSQAARWDMANCGGGLRWQVFSFNRGYNYKNTVSNGCFFLLASRLARYTGNETYVEWAEKAWDWTEGVGLISPDYRFFDGVDVSDNCSKPEPIQWSYNAGMFLAGAAFLYNHTDGDERWRQRVEGILAMTRVFFREDVLLEVACEPYFTCNVDQQSFKGYLARFMALTVQLAPWTADFILPKLRSSAIAAAQHCSFGQDHDTCSLRWWQPEWDGWYGVGEQMSALETIQSNLITRVAPPFTEKRGGTSQGDPNAGTQGFGTPKVPEIRKGIPEAQKSGAKALTAFTIVGLLVFTWWVLA